jgi:hypothetical protein
MQRAKRSTATGRSQSVDHDRPDGIGFLSTHAALYNTFNIQPHLGPEAMRPRRSGGLHRTLPCRHRIIAELTHRLSGGHSVANAWFEQGLKAMIAPRAAEFAEAPAIDRLETCLLAWFDTMARHREVTTQMVSGKLHLSHPHHWVPMVFDLSRLIHWLREAALLPASYGTRRASLEEIGLTGLFVATLNVWMHDNSRSQQRTREFLRRQLERSELLVSTLPMQGTRSKKLDTGPSRRRKAGAPRVRDLINCRSERGFDGIGELNPEIPRVPFSATRVSGAQPNRSTTASSSRAHRSASDLLSNDFALGFMPLRRTWACQRPLSFRIVAINMPPIVVKHA